MSVKSENPENLVDNMEMTSVDRRRELNRVAAQKLRNRQKEKAVTAKQEYFAAQSRNTQLLYDVKQLRKKREELNMQFENHLAICRRSSSFPIAEALLSVASGTYPQFPQFSSQHQLMSPLLLLQPEATNSVMSATVQIVPVTVAPSENHISEPNLADVKQESEHASSGSRLPNGDVQPENGNSDALVNGIHKLTAAGVIYEIVPDVVDAAENDSHATSVANIFVKNSVCGTSSVPASPVTEHAHNTRRRSSLPSLTSSPSEAASKTKARKSQLAVNSDELAAEKSAVENDNNLPVILTNMTDDDCD